MTRKPRPIDTGQSGLPRFLVELPFSSQGRWQTRSALEWSMTRLLAKVVVASSSGGCSFVRSHLPGVWQSGWQEQEDSPITISLMTLSSNGSHSQSRRLLIGTLSQNASSLRPLAWPHRRLLWPLHGDGFPPDYACHSFGGRDARPRRQLPQLQLPSEGPPGDLKRAQHKLMHRTESANPSQ